jgi:uncharacterized protein (TIGR03083 family)
VNADESWQVIAEQRLALARLLAGLSEVDWDAPSLCAGWRVRDVAAHVAMTPLPMSTRSMLAAAVRARGSFHRLNHDLAVRHADAGPAGRLVAELREHAHSRTLPLLTNYRNIVFDVLVHTQDIAIPLGRTHPMPVDAARAAADRVWAMGWPFHAKRRLAGLHLIATDTGWTAGAGAQLRGPVQALLLLLTGRTAAALPRLDGPGAERLAIRSR